MMAKYQGLCRGSILLAVFLVYAAGFFPIFYRVGEVVTALTVIPIAVSAWVMGARCAFITALLYVPINICLLNLAGAPGLRMVLNLWPGVVGTMATGLVLGFLRDALGKLKERTLELAIQSERLQSEIRHRERVQIKLAEANKQLECDILKIRKAEEEKEKIIIDLKDALANIRTLRGLLPICSHCKKIRDDEGYWQQIEYYIHEHSGTQFSHGICPDCLLKYYSD
ncbi:MAG: hypothetical protein ABFD97_18365 [Syntrophobacter sp.]